MLETLFHDINNIINVSANSKKVRQEKTQNPSSSPHTIAILLNGSCGSESVSPNIINSSKRHLSKDETSLLLKSLKFGPVPKHLKWLLKKYLKFMG